MKIFNTMSREKEEFIPMTPGAASIYVCGPTVYNFIHVGNARPLCVFDTLRRYLTYRGLAVNYVSNVTDIDDKLISAASEQGVTVKEIAAKFEEEYLHDADGLNVLRPTVMPRATEHIDEIIALISDIIDQGYGYVAKNGDVYFRALKFEDYGKLSHLVLDELENNRELSTSLEGGLKEDGADFAVWKAAKPGEPAWESPWGPGRPGWHIECSAMAKKHLGATFDIHAGGQDLIFPHHENEIAQSECANHQTFARYWMHNGFLNIDSQKMSKSLGNFRTVRQVSDEMGYEPIRYFMLSAHYRSPLNFTREIMEQAKTSLERLYTCRNNLEFTLSGAADTGENLLAQRAKEAEQRFRERMDDDLNTADALAVLFDLVREINTLMGQTAKAALVETAEIFDRLCGVLGLLYNWHAEEQMPARVGELVEERTAARAAKNWARADEIRAELDALGYVVEDTAAGPKVNKK
ncbi:cysteine--tRNA ligase [Ruminococcaceae bacterium OttesenSCG-928-A11]|nr:cysteine--tRNA ligase [Ruminococcaceae bacterium OttesenSCG-928-A11]